MKFIDKATFGLFVVFLYLFMMESMTLQFTGTYSNYYPIIVLGLFSIEILYCTFIRRDNIITKNPLNIFKYLSYYIILATLIFAIFLPSEALSYYLLVVTSFLSFYFLRFLSLRVKPDLIVYSLTAIAILLVFQYSVMYSATLSFSTMIRNNAAYAIVVFSPYILCNKNKVVAIILAFIVLATVAFSAKRGGTLGVALSIMVYLIVLLKTKKMKKMKKMKNLIFAMSLFMVVLLSIYAAYEFLLNNGQFFDRMDNLENEADNGRLEIINNTISMFMNSDIAGQLFGHGFNATIRDSVYSFSAHNDYVEILYDFGIIGIILYIIFTIQLFKLGAKMIRQKHQYAPAFAGSFFLFLILSNVSHIFLYPHISIPMYSFFGFISMESSKKYIV